MGGRSPNVVVYVVLRLSVNMWMSWGCFECWVGLAT